MGSVAEIMLSGALVSQTVVVGIKLKEDVDGAHGAYDGVCQLIVSEDARIAEERLRVEECEIDVEVVSFSEVVGSAATGARIVVEGQK